MLSNIWWFCKTASNNEYEHDDISLVSHIFNGKLISDYKIEVLCMERIGGESKGFVWPENEDSGWYSYDEMLCIIKPGVPQTRHTFVLSREDLDKIYELMLQHWFFF